MLKFRCSHDYEELLIDELSEFAEWLGDKHDTFERQDVLAAASDPHFDSEEVTADAAAPDSIETTVSQTIRNTAIVKDLKRTYEYRCQVRDQVRCQGAEEPYAEDHHLKSLGEPHKAPCARGHSHALARIITRISITG